MDELTRKMRDARRHVDVAWDEDHAALVLVGMRSRARRRTIARAAASLAAVAIAATIAASIEDRPPAEIAAIRAPEPTATIERTVQLDDGSTIAPLTPETKIVLRAIAPKRVDVDFDAGAGRFDVRHDADRSFVISSGDVRIFVIGTSFTLERDTTRTRVAVEDGRVRVEWPDGARELGAGEAGWFPPENPSKERVELRDRVEEPAPRKRPAERDVPGELFIAADVARKSGRTGEAIPLLRRIADEHSDDPRAPLAAFTLGRVLSDLGRHREAARGYADARRLDPAGSLAEDALVREIEAWSLAGEDETASRRADEYFSRYRDGRRIEDVRMLLR
jgi:transmembrane sensor